ncbi:MAG: hypothetical protein ABSG76_06360 [Xanthobacteraceae bacterium]|jgi:hypothetical protein
MIHIRSLAHPSRSAGRSLAVIGALWRRLAARMLVAYRPERHYMRGPGPKWHARNSSPPR